MSSPLSLPPSSLSPLYYYFKVLDTGIEKYIYTKNYFHNLENIKIYTNIESVPTVVNSIECGTTDEIDDIILNSSAASAAAAEAEQHGGAVNINTELPVPYRYVSYMFNYFYDKIKISMEKKRQNMIANATTVIPVTDKYIPTSNPNSIRAAVETTHTAEFIYIFIKLVQKTPVTTVSADVSIYGYEYMEKLSKTLCIQLKQMEKYDKTIKELSGDKIYYINGSFVYIDPLAIIDITANTNIAYQLGYFIESIYPQYITSYPNTKLSYFVKRCIEDKIMYWV
jgi:hypothetical protein